MPTDEQWQALLEVAREQPVRNRLMLALARDAGLRREEIAGITDHRGEHRPLTESSAWIGLQVADRAVHTRRELPNILPEQAASPLAPRLVIVAEPRESAIAFRTGCPPTGPPGRTSGSGRSRRPELRSRRPRSPQFLKSPGHLAGQHPGRPRTFHRPRPGPSVAIAPAPRAPVARRSFAQKQRWRGVLVLRSTVPTVTET